LYHDDGFVLRGGILGTETNQKIHLLKAPRS
jgi:hypothetical protein